MNYNHLIKIQPNRDPFLFLQEITEVIPRELTVNEIALPKSNWFFECHWDGDPNMPAMLQLEAMSQTASLCLFSLKKPPKKLYLASISNAIFRRKIIPQMEIIVKAKFESEVLNIYKYKCTIRDKNNNKLISKSLISLLWPSNE